MDFPSEQFIHNTCITSFDLWRGQGASVLSNALVPASAAWPSADLAIYIPMPIFEPYLIRKAYWMNGGTIGGNVDMGIFTFTGTKIWSTGATAQVGTTVIQPVDVTDFLLYPGKYFLGMSVNSGTAMVHRMQVVTASLYAAQWTGILNEASAHPLPAVMTPISGAAIQNNLPIMGITNRTWIV
jgi:hypothetical protein